MVLGTDVERDTYFLHKLSKYTNSKYFFGTSTEDTNLRELGRLAPQYLIGSAVQTELQRLDPTGQDVISSDIRSRCKAEGIKLEHLGVTLGTVIHNVDLRHLTESKLKLIKDIFRQRKVVFFRDQKLTKDEHLEFGRLFGKLEVHPFTPHMEGYPEILQIRNDSKNPAAINSWHTDVTWRTEPSFGSVLYMRDKPSYGGDTLFADAHCMFEGLPDDVKARVQGLTATHDFHVFRLAQQIRGVPDEVIDEMVEKFPLAHHPVIRTHPETGKQGVYVCAGFTKHIEGIDDEESERLLGVLYKQSQIPEYQCRFKWEVGSVAFWDNAAVQHYASADYFPHTRVVERVTICGEKPYYRPSATSKI